MRARTTSEKAQTPPMEGVVTPSTVARRFGISASALEGFLQGHAWPRLTYRVLRGQERDVAILHVLHQIESTHVRVSGRNDNTVWERGWREVRDRIASKGVSTSLLQPQYFDRHHVMRLDGQYVESDDPRFSFEYDLLLRRVLLGRYLRGATKIVELGCGTGTSQMMLAQMLPEAELVASDWATASQDIISAIAAHMKRNIRPVSFNMLTLEGWGDLSIDQDSCVLTVHALEQLGSGWHTLLDHLLAAKPRYCVHLEPIAELYDDNQLFDYLAHRYHRRRNYLDGWLTCLYELAGQGKVEIMDVRRLGFGNQYHEASSIVQWRAT